MTRFLCLLSLVITSCYIQVAFESNGSVVCDWYWRIWIEMGLWKGKRLLMVYVSAMFIAVIWILYSCDMPGSGEKAVSSEEITRFTKLAGELELQQKALTEMKELLKSQERWLLQAEVKLRQLYGPKSGSILSEQGPTIYAITPTYKRNEQKAELTRLKQTFLHVPNFHWIVVEDSENKTSLVTKLLRHSGLNYTHLNVLTPKQFKMADKDPNWLKPRGVLQRNLALKWLRTNIDFSTADGVVYFADDDNTYDLQLFDEMRSTQKVSVWPVGLVGYLRYESPKVLNKKVIGWFTYWKPERPFAMDMAGFAINVRLILLKPEAEFRLRVKRGYQESELLSHLVTMDELEPKADQCTKILVWHTRTEKSRMDNEAKLQKHGMQSDPNIEV